MRVPAANLFKWRGKVGRTHYFIAGFLLLALKHNIDRIVAVSFGHEWSVFNYWIFDSPLGILGVVGRQAVLYALLLAIALPFIWIGTVLTLRRLRDANLPLWLVAIFFLPFLNLVLFLILVIVPSHQPDGKTQTRSKSKLGSLIPRSELGSAVFGVVVTAVLAVLLVVFSANKLENYGWGLFVGIPFFLGLNSVLIYGFHESRSWGKCLVVAILSTALVGLALIALAVEGVICVTMALPLAMVLALFGGFIGFVLQQRASVSAETFHAVSVVFLLMPGLMLLEDVADQTPELYSVKTSIVIDANRGKVWSNVVSFSELPKPSELIFKTGLAYPIRAEITGKGVGAVRHCVFSTGPFVEPITKWDEPQLLQFDVTEQPDAMEEMTFYNELRPPHLENYFISKRGQFELKTLPDGKTLLEGTTWYQNRYWPAPYWRFWSDQIIHRIHYRVLSHIKDLSEG
jgi:uncharacterized membrane protein YhaH (DUF805 family)